MMIGYLENISTWIYSNKQRWIRYFTRKLNYTNNMDLTKRNYELKKIMDAYLKSGKSYQELMTFLQV